MFAVALLLTKFVFRSLVVDVPPHGNAFLRLWFRGATSSRRGEAAAVEEVHLFLNDHQQQGGGGQAEECYLFRVYTDSAGL